MITALLAILSVLVQNVIGVVHGQAVAQGRAWLTTITQLISSGCGVLTTAVSVSALTGSDPLIEKLVIGGSIVIANGLGSLLGIWLGKVLHDHDKHIVKPAKARKDA